MTHTQLSEDSLSPHVRKGREGKGSGREGNLTHHPLHLTVGAEPFSLPRDLPKEWMEPLEDLELLDDAERHAHCRVCYPKLGMLEPFTAMCGRRAVHMESKPSYVIPPNACAECVALFDRGPCPACGAAR